MKRAALRYAEILEKGAWVTHQEQAEIAKLLRSLVMTEDQAWDELEARLNRQKEIKQPEQEPWVSLTDEEIEAIAKTPCSIVGVYFPAFARAIEAKLKEKNNG